MEIDSGFVDKICIIRCNLFSFWRNSFVACQTSCDSILKGMQNEEKGTEEVSFVQRPRGRDRRQRHRRHVGQKSLRASGKFARQLFILKYAREGMPGGLRKYSKKTRGGKSGRKPKQPWHKSYLLWNWGDREKSKGRNRSWEKESNISSEFFPQPQAMAKACRHVLQAMCALKSPLLQTFKDYRNKDCIPCLSIPDPFLINCRQTFFK